MTTPTAAPSVDLLPTGGAADGHLPVAKGHGTQNDFVLVPDPDGRADLPPAPSTLLDVTPRQLLALGGLWESWTSPEGEVLRTFCLITTSPNEVMEKIHDRMPVIITPGDQAAWLDPAVPGQELAALLVPYPAEEIEAWPVDRRVSNARLEGPELIRPI